MSATTNKSVLRSALGNARTFIRHAAQGSAESIDEVAPAMINRIGTVIMMVPAIAIVAAMVGPFVASGGLVYWLAWLMVASGQTDFNMALGALAVALVIVAGILITFLASVWGGAGIDHEEINDDLEELRADIAHLDAQQAVILDHLDALSIAPYVRPARNNGQKEARNEQAA